jgi:hypothetical protein
MPLDKLPKMQVINTGGTPLHHCILLVIWCLGFGSLDESLSGGFSKKSIAIAMWQGSMRLLGDKAKMEQLLLLMPQIYLNVSATQMQRGEGRFIHRVLNVLRALFYFSRSCTRQNVS